jgi:MarR family transcriptional regulator, transcriptional regulator for hemolysin
MADDSYLTRSLGFLLGDVSRLIRQRFDDRADDLGLTRAQWRVLAQLRRREGINQSALAEILEIEPITLVRHIDRLVAKDLVERRHDPKDRRAWKLHLKEEVLPVLDRLRGISEQTRDEAMRGLSADQRKQLIDSLLIMKTNLVMLGSVPPDDADQPKQALKIGRSKVHGA